MAEGRKAVRLLSLAIFLLIAVDASSEAQPRKEDKVMKSAVFLSPKFEVEPLYETYLHHWVVVRYYQLKGGNETEIIVKPNSGICSDALNQYFGLGSETRKTATYIPDPYGVEVGNPVDVPHGYEERWLLNVHAIDTRGVEDTFGCTECRCDLYNVTKDVQGQVIEPDYIGGLRCCYDGARCRLRKGFHGSKKSLYMKYTVKYIDWDAASIVPLKIYIFDVTDTWKKPHESNKHHEPNKCFGVCRRASQTVLKSPFI